MGKRKEFVKKAIVCILIIFVGIPIAAGLFVGIFGIGDSTTTNNSTKENSKYIDGIAPVDIYGNLDKNGFEIDRNFSDYGYSWICKKEENGIQYQVTVYSEDEKEMVQTISVSAMTSNVLFDISNALPFFEYISSIPYSEADPTRAQQWIRESYNETIDSLNISNVLFVLNSPSSMVRVLTISKNTK